MILEPSVEVDPLCALCVDLCLYMSKLRLDVVNVRLDEAQRAAYLIKVCAHWRAVAIHDLFLYFLDRSARTRSNPRWNGN